MELAASGTVEMEALKSHLRLIDSVTCLRGSAARDRLSPSDQTAPLSCYGFGELTQFGFNRKVERSLEPHGLLTNSAVDATCYL